jgi:hypothetical protein
MSPDLLDDGDRVRLDQPLGQVAVPPHELIGRVVGAVGVDEFLRCAREAEGVDELVVRPVDEGEDQVETRLDPQRRDVLTPVTGPGDLPSAGRDSALW